MDFVVLMCLLKKKAFGVKGRVITMFDLYVRIVKGLIGVSNAKVDVKYNNTQLTGYTNADGLVVFPNIRVLGNRMDINVDIQQAWIRQLRFIEDWEGIWTPEYRAYLEDWEEWLPVELRFIEDWEETWIPERRVYLEDWEEWLPVSLRFIEDWEGVWIPHYRAYLEDWEEWLPVNLRFIEDWEEWYPVSSKIIEDWEG